ncbi:hypothetical protein ACFYW9_28070 [Streptomyces sp. NPDC002698]|uniref:hypothetical protein n=1 Tax=Streptomyces sp. NPDC002698 TaxID=3364660 RepID=UPI0036A57629
MERTTVRTTVRIGCGIARRSDPPNGQHFGQSSEKAALICQHSDAERQRDAAAGLDDMVRAERAKHRTDEAAEDANGRRPRLVNQHGWGAGCPGLSRPGVLNFQQGQ